jgi:solute:Na+ symporter, SSS family
MLGLHYLDFIVIVTYFAILLVIGILVAKRIKKEEDFLVGSRNLGRLLQTFMNFGMATSVDAPVGASREAFRQGVAGIWIQLYFLFATPFYWITTIWQRRLRISSMGEYYRLRFNSKSMEMFFSFIGIIFLIALISLGMVSLEKTVQVVIPKPMENLSIEENQIIDNFKQLNSLENVMEQRKLTPEENNEFEKLSALKVQGKVKSSIPAINPILLLLIMGIILLVYTVAGGIIAAAITDLFQGVLLIVLSLLLLPFALAKVGWFTGLHAKVPDSFFTIFGSSATSEYPWYYIVVLIIMGVIITESAAHNMQIFGSAKDEETARVGRIGGLLIKRLTVVLWGFTGIVGYALYKNNISDPDMLWGYMSARLLLPGLVGLMLVCIIAALQSSASAFLVSTSALFTRNFYQHLFPNRSQKEYVKVSRIVCAFVLVFSIFVTLYFDNFLSIVRFTWSIGLVFGPVFWLGIIWRRLTTKAAWVGIIYSFLITVLLGHFGENLNLMSESGYFCQKTTPYTVSVTAAALQEDIDQGDATSLGQTIEKEIKVPSTGIFFEEVIKQNPDDSDSKVIGKKRFRSSLIIPAILNVPFFKWRKAQIISLGYYLDVLVPLLLMIFVSFFTKQNNDNELNQFYGRLHTPVRGSREDDEKEMELTRRDPKRFSSNKVFPNSSIELLKPTTRDWVGFLLVCAASAIVILILLLLTKIGS